MKNFIILFLFVFLFPISCNKLKIADGTPSCIKTEIKKFSKSHGTCPSAHVDEMEFQSSTVYVFDDGGCMADGGSTIYDKNALMIGSLGGFTGNTKVNGQEFSSATFIKTVWKK